MSADVGDAVCGILADDPVQVYDPSVVSMDTQPTAVFSISCCSEDDVLDASSASATAGVVGEKM